MSFLPEGYKSPNASNYMKFAEGSNKFRILSPAIVGFEYWTEEDGKKKPIRVKHFEDLPDKIKVEQDSTKKAKHFFAFAVYNYNDAKIQILEVTQKGIQDALKAYSEDEDWGDPTKYDIVVKRDGEGFDTSYQVTPKPHSEFKAATPKEVNLEALFTGNDPFDTTAKLSSEDRDELDEVLQQELPV